MIFWKFDRFARSTRELINALEEFNNLGVEFISYKESIDTSTLADKIPYALISAFAEFERAIICERVISGMEKAKARRERFGKSKESKIQNKNILFDYKFRMLFEIC